jgi:hypothetical protein
MVFAIPDMLHAEPGFGSPCASAVPVAGMIKAAVRAAIRKKRIFKVTPKSRLLITQRRREYERSDLRTIAKKRHQEKTGGPREDHAVRSTEHSEACGLAKIVEPSMGRVGNVNVSKEKSRWKAAMR